MRILVVNAGSSSIKLTVLGDRDEVLAQRVELGMSDAGLDPGWLRTALDDGLGDADVVVHRIVHGGQRLHGAVRIDAAVEREIRSLRDLAPLHQGRSLAALDAVSAARPELPAFACFDTGFHRTLPAAASTYALPSAWRSAWGLQRYGFHGLSHAWVARRAPEVLAGDPRRLRIVSCHLGSGASLCAIAGGSSIDTTMGFTPLEGLVMATRSGSVDPGLLLWLLERGKLGEPALADALEHGSGLQGLGGSSDMREIVERANGDDNARLALDVYLHRLRAGIGAMAASLGGLDVLVFTGGVGEHSADVRAGASRSLGFLGVELDLAANERATGDADISAAHARTPTLVLEAREDLEMAAQVRDLTGNARV